MTKKRKLSGLILVVILLSYYPSVKVSRVYWEVSHTYLCDKQIIVFESDDWGMCGVRDREAFDNLTKKGYDLGKDQRGHYSLETVEDLEKLYSVLRKHKDARGNCPVFTFNFIVTNPDFDRISQDNYNHYYYKSLVDGLPSKWKRGNLYEQYLRGIELGLVYPGYHGRGHFNYRVWLKLLQKNDSAATDFFHEQMTYRYSPLWQEIKGQYIEMPATFLDYAAQEEIIEDGVAVFQKLFGFAPLTTIAPGYHWNDATEEIWSKVGIKAIQGSNRHHSGASEKGKTIPGKVRYLGEKNKYGMVYLVRNMDFEPWAERRDLGRYSNTVEILFAIGEPVIICTHSINYMSSIYNFRDNTLSLLDSLLTTIEGKYEDILYLTDAQLANAITDGYFELSNGERVYVRRKKSLLHDLRSTISKVLYKASIKISNTAHQL